MPDPTIPRCDRLWINARLATMVAGPTAYGATPISAIGVSEEKIAVILPMEHLGEDDVAALDAATEVIDCRGAWITPGLVDCHTHLIYAGNRSREIEKRWSGASYESIARQGGGILATVHATRAMSESELFAVSLPRLRALLADGVTTVEIKSGYGLTLRDELKMLRVARRMAKEMHVNVSTTLLAAHALPPEFVGRADDYVTEICEAIIPAAAADGLADAVDAFCEHIAFSPAQCERIFAAAAQHGLPVKGHFEQLSDVGGAHLAARFKALSADHLEHLGAAGVRVIADAGTVAVLLPGAYYFLRETQKPPVAELRAAAVPIAVGSDLNPGTCPMASLRLMLNMACTLFDLTPEEALLGVTRHAAKALGLADRLGTLAVGKQADFLLWDIDDPAELVCQFGVPNLRQRVFKGRVTGQLP